MNLFGAPGAGKSSLALLISAYIKMRFPQFTVECPNEIAKMVYYDEAPKALKCQLYIAGLQQWQIERCEGHVDIVVCDSPVLLSSVYGDDTGQALPPSFHEICRHYHNKYPTLNYFIKRTHPFEEEGRFHKEADETRLMMRIREALVGIDYITTVSSETTASEIAVTATRRAELLRSKQQSVIY